MRVALCTFFCAQRHTHYIPAPCGAPTECLTGLDNLTGRRGRETSGFSVEDWAFVEDSVPQGVPNPPYSQDLPRYFVPTRIWSGACAEWSVSDGDPAAGRAGGIGRRRMFYGGGGGAGGRGSRWRPARRTGCGAAPARKSAGGCAEARPRDGLTELEHVAGSPLLTGAERSGALGPGRGGAARGGYPPGAPGQPGATAVRLAQPHPDRAHGRQPRGRGAVESPDRRPAVHFAPDRADAPRPRLRQARPHLPRPAGRRGHPAGKRVNPVSARWPMFRPRL